MKAMYALIFGASLLVPCIATAQVEVEPVTDDGEKVFTLVEVMPEFPGGQEALYRYLGSNIKYPEAAIDAGISGTVYVRFVVDKEGNITRAEVLRGIGGGCDEEALRVVKAMPRWTPGYQKGKPILVQYNLPIKYTLNGGGTAREDKLHTEVDVLARFPGGEVALQRYLAENAVHPKEARKATGVVTVRFEVDRDGRVRDAEVINPLHPALDQEALRVVNAMPEWQPAVLKLKVVRSVVQVDVSFPKYVKK